MKLIHKFLKSGVMEHGLVSPTREGTPQGGNLSPLLSNIYLTAFDRLLESRGHKFVRYADDCHIYVKSRRAAERVMASCVKFLEGTLKLTVNQAKSQVGSPLRLKFLGFSLHKTGRKAGIRPHQKSIKRFKDKIRELTSRKQARSVELILKRLKRYTTGWLGYYSIVDMESHMKRLPNGSGAEYGRYIGNSGRKSRQSTITSCALESIIPKRGSGRTAERHIGA